MEISFIIPTINSKDFIAKTVIELYDYFKYRELKFEIIIVQDSDEKDLWKKIKKLCKSNTNIRAIKLYKNFGQHYANHVGFISAKGKFIITLDDDGNIPPDQISVLIEKQKSSNAEYVIGNFINKKQTFIRKIGTLFINKFYKINYGIKNDLHITNFRLIKNNLIKRVISKQLIFPFTSAQLLNETKKVSWASVKYRIGYRQNSSYRLINLSKLLFNVIIFYSNDLISKLTILYILLSLLVISTSTFLYLFSIFNKIAFIMTIIISILFVFQILLLRLIAKYYDKHNNKKNHHEIISSIEELS